MLWISGKIDLINREIQLTIDRCNHGRSGQGAGVGVGMLRGGGDSKILFFQDVRQYFKISKILVLDFPRCTIMFHDIKDSKKESSEMY